MEDKRKLVEKWLREATRRLLEVDPKIKAIVAFGSCVYAPELAHDLDLLVITEEEKDLETYWDALAHLPLDVDVIVNRAGKPLGDGLKPGILAFGKLLWGEDKFVREVLGEVPVPTFEDVRRRLRDAERYIELARSLANEVEKIGPYRDAFNALFDAARLAVMAFLCTEQTRWGELRRSLPPPFDERFRRIVNQLHVRFFYHISFSTTEAESLYQRWRREVEDFVSDLERAMRGKEKR